MTKELIFDMDGTIADLYAVEGWLEKLRAEDVSPYADAAPMYDMSALAEILIALKEEGFKISVVSWGAMNGSVEYGRRTRKTKIEWLKAYGFPYDEIHVVKYGTPKQRYAKSDLCILVDDNADVRNAFTYGAKDENRIAIDATKDIIAQLIDLLICWQFD